MKASLSTSSSLSLPEEILEHIISLAFFSAEDSHAPKASALSLLLVCKAFERMAKPLLYSSLHLQRREQSDKLAEILIARPSLAAYIRAIRVDGPSASRALLVAAHILSNSHDSRHRVLDVLDVRLVDERGHPSHRTLTASQAKEDLERLNSALRTCPDTRCLIMRQDGYLSCNTTMSFVHALASGVRRWHSLEIVDLRTRPIPIPSSLGQPRPDPFAVALSEAPNLKVLRACQPTLLNSFLLDTAKSPSLQRIELINSTAGLPNPDSRFSFFLRFDSINLVRHHHLTNSTPAPPRQPQHTAPICRRAFEDVGLESEILDAATMELEAQLASEPQTLFAKQIVAHPRLCSLIRAGRLQFIIDRMLMERNERRFGGDSRKESGHESMGRSGVHLSVCPGLEVGLPGPACNGCPALRAGL